MIPPKGSEKIIPEVLVVPGLFFGINGQRLGRGKGFYDKYLADYKGVTIGVCYETQMRTDVPVFENDINVDFIVTNERRIKCSD